ncbi:hypothetical protein JCM8097_008061 [Rhodosporidiobolus ruineniae]
MPTSMPRMMYGTAWKGPRTASLVVDAVLSGFRGIDTACQPKHYHQPGVGEALKTLNNEHGIRREDLFLQTKFTALGGQDLGRPLPYDRDAPLAEQVRQSVATSLHELGTSYLDSLVLHSPMSTQKEHQEVWGQFEAFVREGKVLQIGLSNIYDAEHLEWIFETASIKPTVIQNRFYADVEYGRDILALCAKHGAKFQSFWTLTGNPQLLRSPLLARLSSSHSLPSPSAAFFLSLLRQTRFGRGTIVPLNGTTSKAHMEEATELVRRVEAEEGDEEGRERTLSEEEGELERVLWG